jgi:hypothetical protein
MMRCQQLEGKDEELEEQGRTVQTKNAEIGEARPLLFSSLLCHFSLDV